MRNFLGIRNLTKLAINKNYINDDELEIKKTINVLSFHLATQSVHYFS